MRNVYKEYESAVASTGANDTEITTQRLKTVWADVKSTYEKMNVQILRIYNRIGEEYENFIEACQNDEPISAVDLLKRITTVAEKRLAIHSNPQ